MTSPLLTIAIPTYNRALYLDQMLAALENEILGLSFELQNRINICVIDNASTDDTQEVLIRHQSGAPFIRFERNPTNIGIEGNLIRASICATGKYTWMISDHQTVTPGALEKLINVILGQEPTIIVMDIAQWPTKYMDAGSVSRPISSLHPDEVGEIVFLAGNVSTNAYLTRLALETSRLAHRISYSSYPNLAKLTALTPEDTLCRIPNASAFPNSLQNSSLKRHYDTFEASFVDHLTIARKVLPRCGAIRWGVKGFQDGAYRQAMAYELATMIALGRRDIMSKLLRAVVVNFRGLLPTKCTLLATTALAFLVLPQKIRRSLIVVIVRKIAPGSNFLKNMK
ncbi:glycosyltransferase family 2 protein [Chromobacterium haemolyticum]|uniref:glycosyltransferase family 2 protein n=1 Tax=Chromobacterium haemolyticum TaxID=394935 RepID=UPI0040570C6C